VRKRRGALGLAAALLLSGIGIAAAAKPPPAFTPQERAAILSHGPWPEKPRPDTSNRVSAQPAAVAFGEQLFFEPRLSVTGSISCATCHVPASGWAEPKARAAGIGQTRRNAPSVINSGFSRWFGWGGATDSLWAASLRPLLDPLEMGNAERHAVALVRSDASLACGYRAAFGAAEGDNETAFVNLGKALAAFQETLVSSRTPFDDFRDAVARNDPVAASHYPADARRGLRLFIGKAQCNVCHIGPRFTNDEFDKVGIPVRAPDGVYDWGRYDGIKAVLASRFNRRSRHNDGAAKANAVSTDHVSLNVEAYGAFKVPGLRNVALTAPYMHDGSLATLHDVVRHYSEIDEVKLHIAASHPHPEMGEELPPRPTESVLRTLNLSEREIADLVAFLESLSERRPLRRPGAAAPAGCR
jgi:cytochrome c peroxidase